VRFTASCALLVAVILAAPGGHRLTSYEGQASASQEGARPGIDWPQFRGISASGVAEGFALPVRWNADTGENVRWKAAVPGLAHSSPVVWRDMVCASTAVAVNKEEALKVGLYGDITSVDDTTPLSWEVHCFDKKTGARRWHAVAHKGVPKIKRHPKGTHANSTLATDGRHIVALFGSEGLFAYDMSGTLLWKKDLGTLTSAFFMAPEAQWGFASSPIISGDLVVVQADVLKGSFLAAFDVESGKEIWRTPRNDYPTWSTPSVHAAGGRTQVIVNGFSHIGGYDLRTGKEIWRMKGGGDIPVPTPVFLRDLAFITNAHGPAAPIFAVRTSATGDISLPPGTQTSAHVAWSQQREGAYMQTPLIYGDHLYVCRDNGVFGVYEAGTGKRLYQQRLADGRTGFSASAVAGDGKVYYTSEDGSVFVVKAGPAFEQLAENVLGETAMATPAISEGTIFWRTRTRIVAVGR
jgi:outer membrane protein assembly factor BamB